MDAAGAPRHVQEGPIGAFFPGIPSSATNAGSYYVWYGVEGDAWHMNVEPVPVEAIIEKASIDPKVTIRVWAEGGKANVPLLVDGSNPGGGDVTFEYAPRGTENWSATPPTAAGDYTVRATVAETANYLGAQATKDFRVYSASGALPVYRLTVAFDVNGGSGSMSSQRIVEGTAATLKANAFTRAGYVFSGWNTAKDGSGLAYDDEAIIVPASDITLYAQWEQDGSEGGGEEAVRAVSGLPLAKVKA